MPSSMAHTCSSCLRVRRGIDLDRDFLFWFDVVRHGESRFQGWFGSNGNPNMTLGSSGCPTVRILIEGSNQCGQQVDAAPGVLGHWDVNGGSVPAMATLCDQSTLSDSTVRTSCPEEGALTTTGMVSPARPLLVPAEARPPEDWGFGFVHLGWRCRRCARSVGLRFQSAPATRRAPETKRRTSHWIVSALDRWRHLQPPRPF